MFFFMNSTENISSSDNQCEKGLVQMEYASFFFQAYSPEHNQELDQHNDVLQFTLNSGHTNASTLHSEMKRATNLEINGRK